VQVPRVSERIVLFIDPPREIKSQAVLLILLALKGLVAFVIRRITIMSFLVSKSRRDFIELLFEKAEDVRDPQSQQSSLWLDQKLLSPMENIPERLPGDNASKLDQSAIFGELNSYTHRINIRGCVGIDNHPSSSPVRLPIRIDIGVVAGEVFARGLPTSTAHIRELP
jgi:hypothetical protein